MDFDNVIFLDYYSPLLSVVVFGKDCWGCRLTKDGVIGSVALAKKNRSTRSRCPSF